MLAHTGGPALLTESLRVELILPVFNAQPRVERAHQRVWQWVSCTRGARATFVDDGSTDGTAEALEALCARDGAPRMRVLRCANNRGKGAAVRLGALASTAERVCFTDADLPYEFAQLDALVAALDEADVAIGSRALAGVPQKNITLERKVMGAAFNALVRGYLGLPHRDTQAGLKGFTRTAARVLFQRQTVDGFAFDAELLFLARRLGLRVREVPAYVVSEHSYRASTVRLSRAPVEMFVDVLRLRWVHR